METMIEKFYIKAVLGGGVKTDDPDSLIDGCIRKAYDDMMTGGRFFGIEGKDERCAAIRSRFEAVGFKHSLDLISSVAETFAADSLRSENGSRYATAFGLSQKIVNMAFKYLYCVKAHLDIDIDFADCDCPLDNVVLETLPAPHTTWTKLEQEEYLAIQNEICNEVDRLIALGDASLPKGLSKGLMYDFLSW